MTDHAELRCDICGFRDGHGGFDLIQCCDCGVAVHKECNGMSGYRRKIFRCPACDAVGKSFQIRKRGPDGRRLRIIQEERPTKCDLCSVRDGVHAMHPIFDGSGRTGRFLFHDTEPPRLVWGHSLCAYYLSTQGLMHGCSRDGHYDGMEEEEDPEPDDGSVNPDLARPSPGELADYGNSAPIHHFVYYQKKPYRPHTDWTLAVEHQKSYYRCFICGKDDDKRKVFRIPAQCVAGSEEEYEDFKYKHNTLGPEEVCKSAAHVGCARWGGSNPNGVKRVYYFPGTEDQDVVACMYCTLHGEDVDGTLQKKRKAQQEQQKRAPAPEAIEVRRPTKVFPRAHPSAVLPSLAKIGTKKRPRSKPVPGPRPSGPSRLPAVLPPRRASEKPDKILAVPVSQGARPTLANSRKFLAHQKSVVPERSLEKLVEDLGGRILGKIYDAAERSRVLKERKKFWKRELSELSTEDFKGLWLDAKEKLKDLIIEDEKAKRKADEEREERARIERRTVDLTLGDDDDQPPGKPPSQHRASSGDVLGSALAAQKKPGGHERRGLGTEDSSDEETDEPEGVPDRWAHLYAGSHFHAEKYEFGDWDSVEILT